MPIMQPNDQNQQPQNPTTPSGGYVSPSGADVPEYLHMEPVADLVAVSRKKRRMRFILLSSVIVPIILIGLGALGYWMWLQNTPQEKFYRALEKQMHVNYVKRSIDLKKGGSSAMTVALTDTSNPIQTKSDMTISEGAVGKTNFIVLDSNRYAVSVESASSEAAQGELQLNQWYDVPFHTAARKEVGYWIDEIGSPLILNSVQGLALIGNFSDGQRSRLMDYIRTQNVYRVLNVRTVVDHDIKLTGYNVQLSLDRLNALNKQAVKLLELKQLFTIQKPYPGYQEIVFWVSEATGMLTKITYNSGESKDKINTEQTVDYIYPDALSIKAPSKTKQLLY